MLTSTNADSVPMLIISSRISTWVKPASSATATPLISCSRTGVLRVSEVTISPRGNRPSAHRQQHTRQANQQHHDHRGQADKDGDRDKMRRPRSEGHKYEIPALMSHTYSAFGFIQ